MNARIVCALLTLSVSAPALAGTPAAKGDVKFTMANGAKWKASVGKMPVAARSSVEKAIAAEVAARYGKGNVKIQLSQPHHLNIAFDGREVTTIPRVFASVSVNGISKGEIYADARRGKVSIYKDANDLRPKYGLRPMDEVIAEKRAQDDARTQTFRRSPQLDVGALNKPVIIMSRVGVNGQFPGVTVPTWFAVNPLVQMTTLFMGGIMIPTR